MVNLKEDFMSLHNLVLMQKPQNSVEIFKGSNQSMLEIFSEKFISKSTNQQLSKSRNQHLSKSRNPLNEEE